MLERLLHRCPARVREITAADLAAELASPAPPLLIDIRSAAQFAAGHIPGALQMPPERLRELPPSSRPAVVY